MRADETIIGIVERHRLAWIYRDGVFESKLSRWGLRIGNAEVCQKGFVERFAGSVDVVLDGGDGDMVGQLNVPGRDGLRQGASRQ